MLLNLAEITNNLPVLRTGEHMKTAVHELNGTVLLQMPMRTIYGLFLRYLMSSRSEKHPGTVLS